MIPLRKNDKIKSAGIYMIEAENRKKYIGSAVHLSRRCFNKHLASLKNNRHSNTLLQNHFNKYGESDLWFEIIEFVHKEGKESVQEYKARLLSREQYWIDYYDSANRKKGFNLCPVAGSVLGRIQSEEEKELRRYIWSDETFKLQVSITMKKSHADFKGENHPMYGKKYNITKIRKDKGLKRKVSYPKGAAHKGFGIKHKYPKGTTRKLLMTEKARQDRSNRMKEYYKTEEGLLTKQKLSEPRKKSRKSHRTT